jgi:predicted phage gp36 major capsid-like protein
VTESEDLRAFVRDLMARFDRGMDAVTRKQDQLDRKFELAREESRRYFEALDRRLEEDARRTDDIIADNRAQRDALFRILDRLDNGGTAPAT